MNAVVAGWLILGVPLLLIGLYFLWNRARPVFWMYLAAVLIGLGYLTATGAVGSVGSLVVKSAPAKAPASAPAPAAAPAPAPAK